MKKVFFRPSVGRAIGMGHFSRSIALAEYLVPEFECVFFIPESLPELSKQFGDTLIRPIYIPDLSLEKEALYIASNLPEQSVLVLDGYDLDTVYQQTLKTFRHTIVSIDDIHQIHFLSDVIINQQPEFDHKLYSCETYTQIFSGLEYVLLRKAYLDQVSEREKIDAVENVLINMGGSDAGNITQKVVNACLRIKPELKNISVVVGALYPYINEIKEFAEQRHSIRIYKGIDPFQFSNLMKDSDLGIFPASTVSLEAISVGIGLLSGYTAENQLGNLRSLARNGVLISSGSFYERTEEELAEQIQAVVNNPDMLNDQLKSQKKLIDGKAKERYLNIFRRL